MSAKTLMKFTPDDKSNARKAGFKKKAPKKPGRKTFEAMARYIDNYNNWVKDLKAAAVKGRQMETMKRAINGGTR